MNESLGAVVEPPSDWRGSVEVRVIKFVVKQIRFIKSLSLGRSDGSAKSSNSSTSAAFMTEAARTTGIVRKVGTVGTVGTVETMGILVGGQLDGQDLLQRFIG